MIAYLEISGLLSLSTWVLVLLPNFLAERGWSSQRIGWAVGCYFLVNLIFQIVSGRLADRYGYIRTALAGAVIVTGGGILYVGSLWITGMIWPARALHAMGAAMIFAGALLHLVQSVPLHLRGRMIGYYGLPGFAMIGLGPVLAEWLVCQWGFRAVFVCVPILSAVIGAVLWRLPRSFSPSTAKLQSFPEAFRVTFPPLRSILTFSVLFGLCFAAWNSFIAPAVRSVGTGGVSGFGFGYGAGAVMTRLGVSHRLDTGWRRYPAIATLIAYGASVALVPSARSAGQLLALGFACGMVHGIYYPSLSSIAAERFHPLHTGQAMSLYLSASALGMFVGPPLWGALVDRWGYPPMFVAAGSVMTLGTLIFLVAHHRLTRPSGRNQISPPRF